MNRFVTTLARSGSSKREGVTIGIVKSETDDGVQRGYEVMV